MASVMLREWSREATSSRCVNSGAEAMETICEAEGRNRGSWDQHITIRSSTYTGYSVSCQGEGGRSRWRSECWTFVFSRSLTPNERGARSKGLGNSLVFVKLFSVGVGDEEGEEIEEEEEEE